MPAIYISRALFTNFVPFFPLNCKKYIALSPPIYKGNTIIKSFNKHHLFSKIILKMERYSNGNNNFTPSTMPVKRKRGRPHKEKSLKNSMQITPTLNNPPSMNFIGEADGSFVGQPVTGVIEASFDAGFLVNLKLGNSGTCLRGVVFKPGQYYPVSAENDVAPHIQMISRKEIPLPKENQNGGFVGKTSGPGFGQLLHNNGLISESTTVKNIETSIESPNYSPLQGVVKPVGFEQFSSLNRGFQNCGSVNINKNGFLMPCEVNKRVETSSQTLEGNLANGNDGNKHLDLESLPFMQSVNNNSNQSQEALGLYNNSRMGPMSMLLQVVQEKMVKPEYLS